MTLTNFGLGRNAPLPAHSPLHVITGAISAKDMTTEAVVTKLGVLIGCGYGDEKVRDLMSRSLCGEMTPDTSQSLSKL